MVFWTWLDRLMAGLFFLSAAVQYNDPDPLAWMAMYTAAAVACLLPASVRHRATVAWLVAAVSCFATLRMAPAALALEELSDLTATMAAARPEVEAAREALGLAIVSLWCAGLGTRDLWMRVSDGIGASSG
ncbi:MAG TPA: hypothetical protein DFR83_28435 [Deltaproteobacteria bacterium]|nr:hypothetical protein [Deltaproteobacteria bacterium]